MRPARLRPVDGRIDLAPLRAGAPAVVRASERLAEQDKVVEAIDVRPLAPEIARPVTLLQDKIARADALADRASRAVRLLPSMLGAHGKRNYLFLFQNNAEVRATGGIPGSFALLTASHGKVTLGRQDDAGSLGRFVRPPIPLTGEEKALFGQELRVYPQDVNFTPDFPRTAELAAAMYRSKRGLAVDGVVSVDPVALSYLLRGTGPVTTAGGRRRQPTTLSGCCSRTSTPTSRPRLVRTPSSMPPPAACSTRCPRVPVSPRWSWRAWCVRPPS